MPAEQPSPGGLPLPELSPLTETELRTSAAVKLTHIQLAELKQTYHSSLADLQTERQRIETLTSRAHSCETECCVLQERLGVTGQRDLVVRLIEAALVVILSFAIDFAKSGERKSFEGSIIIALFLVIAIIVIQYGYRPKRVKETE